MREGGGEDGKGIPVATVPLPLIGKQWSTRKTRSSGLGSFIRACLLEIAKGAVRSRASRTALTLDSVFSYKGRGV